MARYAAKRPQGNGDKGYKNLRKIKAVAHDGRPPILLTHTRKPCYLSQTAGLHRFLILYKDYNTAAFFTGSGFSGAKIRRKIGIWREIQRKTEKVGEKRKKIRENQRKTEKNGEFKRKSEKNGKIRRKSEKIGGLSGNFRAYPQELSVNQCSYP